MSNTVASKPAGVTFSLFDPLSDRGFGQVEVAGDLTDRTIATLTHLDDLGLELIGERTARARPLLAPHALHDGKGPRILSRPLFPLHSRRHRSREGGGPLAPLAARKRRSRAVQIHAASEERRRVLPSEERHDVT